MTDMRSGRRRFLASFAAVSFLIAFHGSVASAAITPDGAIIKIAFGSCAKQWLDQPIWNAVLESRPDVFLFLGDAIYGDYDGEKAFVPNKQTLLRDWGRLGAQPGYRALREQVPVMATWDNHDYGKHDGGAEFAFKETSKRLFLDFFGEPTDSERRTTPGIYDARIVGPVGRRVQIILLDTRYFKGPYLKDNRSKAEKNAAGLVGSMGNYVPNEDPDVSLLGEAQWQWLERQLLMPAEVRLIASSTQVVNDEKNMDEWGNYPLERRRLFDLIESTGASGVLLLSGNVHYTEISRLERSTYPLVDFTSSGMTHTNEHYAGAENRYRVAGPSARKNFGLIEIDWAAKPSPKIELQAVGSEGSTLFDYRVHLHQLHIE
jgi:alkaline phosphatase D